MAIYLLLTLFVLAVAFIAIFLFKIIEYCYSYFFWGAIYVSTTEEKVKQMISILDLKGKQKAVDLGSGDGRLVIALAKAGIVAYGYEINPFLVSIANKNIKNAGVEGKAFVYHKNLWKENLGEFDVVVIYPMAHMMKKLEKKLEKELKPGAQVVSNYFTFPKWQHAKKENNVYLYIKSKQHGTIN